MVSLLVIEPDEAQGHHIKSALELAGFIVWWVPKFDLALAICQQHKPDAVILDPAQQELSWSATMSECLDFQPGLAIIIFSTDTSREAVLQALQMGAADYVLKDDDRLDALIASIQRLRTSHQLRQPAKMHHLMRETLSSIEEDLRAGRHVQRSLLPEKPYETHGVYADYVLHASMYLSGDLVDYFELQPGWFLFYILDVSGHGVASALITILLRNEINRLRRDWHLGMDETIEHPDRVLAHLNQVLLQSELGKHATLWLGLLDVRLKTLTYANAGHYPYPLMLRDGALTWLQQPKVPLGLFPEPNYETLNVSYDLQLSIVLCSDGVFEIMSDLSLAEREACWHDIVQKHPMDVTHIAAAMNVSENLDANDDMTILMIAHGEVKT